MKIKILFEDRYIIVVEKQQGIPVQSDKTKDEDLMKLVLNYLREKTGYDEPYLGLIHRIDRPVGGVVVFAKNRFANSNLSEQIRSGSIGKLYLTVVCGQSTVMEKQLDDYMKKLVTINMSKITDKTDKKAKLASLKYHVLDTIETDEYGVLSLLKIELYTGRHHQIRLQLSNEKLPIWGDNKYNKIFVKKKEFTNIALWAESYSFNHPKSNKRMEFICLPKNIYPFTLFNV
ncbi:RNA pseudouridine synthase [Sedimentibacter sp. zth1]|uniref:RluA family pseudouridine synthase n=1 Tax=Sedimentibacter sp. zth1 TaxID=2816908 RepID=UPI001A938CC2|nr:RNA pseudouridine synthase [Sedimentibacter sp. zth1]QSX05495.1 RNA pseudouridine synthase [Sedimentibacter sp. zth1]